MLQYGRRRNVHILLASAVGSAIAIPLAIETEQRVWYVLSNRDSHIYGCDVRGRLSAIKCEDDSISLSSFIIVPILYRDNNCIYTVSQKKTCDYIFYNNFNNKCPITIIFCIVSSMSMSHRKMVSFPTSPI